MLTIIVGKDPIDKSLKIFKKKFDRTGVLKELKSRKEFKKKSVTRREKLKKAIYIQQKFGDQN
jgi:small subunit ribosomal protein S21